MKRTLSNVMITLVLAGFALGAAAETTASASFFPQVNVKTTSAPTIIRNGIQLPLRPEMLQETPLDLTIPQVHETTLTNGIKFYTYESHDLPSVYITVLLKAGKNLDPAEKVGLAEVTLKTLRAGGSAKRSGDQIDRDLEQIGSNLEVSADREFVRLSMFALAEKRDQALGILAELLTSPAFDEKKLQQQKDLRLEEVRRENDDPEQVARREFRKVLYGRDNPLARTPRPENISGITREDVRKFYEDFYRPGSVWFGMAGDVTTTQAQESVEKAFAGWTKPPAELPPPPTVDVEKDKQAGIFYIRKATAQAQVRVGHLGIPRYVPETPAVTVMNLIYGSGGFSSRLMQNVRTAKGYAYGVGGALNGDSPVGLFGAAASTKSNTTVAAIEEILRITRELPTQPIDDAELEIAKRDAIFGFVTNFDVASEIVFQYMYHDILGFPPDYLENYLEKIRGVTKQDVIQAAKKFVDPAKLKILVLGDVDSLDKPLSSLGEPQEIVLEPFRVGTPESEARP